MSILRDTEEQFASFSPLKRFAVTASAALMIIAGVWFFWTEDTQERIELAEARKIQLSQQIRQVNTRGLAKKIEELKLKRLESEERFQESEKIFRFLRTKIEGVRKIKFDQERLADLLDAILKRSVELGLRIEKIESRPSKDSVTPFLEKKRRVSVEGSGKFADIVKLTYFLESLDMLVKLKSVAISLDKEGRTIFAIDIDAYGIKR
ncbi:MAG: hypothetical protein L3J42_06095 [Hydrogenimonas sp.]|nr:hypothetical protein [Hydrogenimonas sp.]